MDRVICVVNNDAITLYELDEAERLLPAPRRGSGPPTARRAGAAHQLLQNLIENRIQLQQAEREKITIEDAELERGSSATS